MISKFKAWNWFTFCFPIRWSRLMSYKQAVISCIYSVYTVYTVCILASVLLGWVTSVYLVCYTMPDEISSSYDFPPCVYQTTGALASQPHRDLGARWWMPMFGVEAACRCLVSMLGAVGGCRWWMPCARWQNGFAGWFILLERNCQFNRRTCGPHLFAEGDEVISIVLL